MDENGRPVGTGSFRFDLREIISEVRRDAEKRKAESRDPLGDTTPAVKATWIQRVSNWYRRD